jgi:carboxyl-terminal processing protease
MANWLTLAKFYRVSGQSTQHQGVLPDIDYPSIIDTKEIGESALPEAMPWDTIRPAIKPVADPFKPFLAAAQGQHEARSAKDAEFVFIRDRLALAQKLMDEKTVSLNEAGPPCAARPTSKPSNWRWKTSAARPRAKSRSKS